MKDQSKDLQTLENYKQEAADKKVRLQDEEGRMNVIQDKVAEYEAELGPIKSELIVVACW